MTLHYNWHFGFEGEVYWSTDRFNGLDVALRTVPTDTDIQNWIAAASRSDQPRTVSFQVGRQVVDMTGRFAAEQGYRSHFSRVNNISVRFNIFHNQTDADLAKSVVTQMFTPFEEPSTKGEISMAFFSHDGTGARGNREGIIGHFQLAGGKQEPLRGMQQWSVTAVNTDYVRYWRDP